MQILSVERRCLTIVLMYGIITAEKEFMRSRIFDFLIASISHRNGFDHTFDHLRLRTTWTQCAMKPWKASISDTKALKITRKCLFYKAFTVRDVEVASSNLVTSTTKKEKRGLASLFFLSYYNLLISASVIILKPASVSTFSARALSSTRRTT